MVEKEQRVANIGRSIIRRVYWLMLVLLVSTGIIFFFYYSLQNDLRQYEIRANEYHSKTIRLSLEILDELRVAELWFHAKREHERASDSDKGMPKDFTIADRMKILGKVLEEDLHSIILAQNQFEGIEFKSTLLRVVKSNERFIVFLRGLNDQTGGELYDKYSEPFLVAIKQLRLLHSNALKQLRTSIIKKQKINDKYMSYVAVAALLMVLWIVIGFVRNIKSIISKYQLALMNLGSSKSKTEILMQSTGEGIYGVDLDGNCIFANDSCVKILGYDNYEELLGKNMHQLIQYSYANGDEYPVEQSIIYRAHLAGEKIRRDDEVFWRKDGRSFAVEYTSSPITERGEINGSVITFNDITERKQIENELAGQHEHLENLVEIRTHALQEAKEDAERANELKSEFLGRMSHELRTPMNAILGFGQLMELEDLQTDQQSFLGEIMTAARHLLRLIDEVLDLATIEAGKISLVFEDFSADELISECISNMKPIAAEHGISLSAQIDACSDINLRMDRMRTKEVLLNLFSNAIKYNSEAGKVLVNCEIITMDRLRINVIDTGPGIDKEKQFMLFEPFNRLGEEYGETEGTGIGLSISKHLMECMDGKIGMQSVPSGGSMFWIECNIGQSIHQDGVQSDSTVADDMLLSSSQHKVLYVEDNPANLRLVQNIFVSHSNAKLLTAPTAEMGIELARESKPDIILMDINLPGMDGYEALSRLRNYPETKDIPVIAISAAAMPRDIDRGLAAGFMSYLAKPIQVKELLDTIKSLLVKKNVSGGH